MVRRRDGGDRLPAELAAFDPRRWEDRADPPDARLRQAYRRWRWARVTWGLEHGDEALSVSFAGLRSDEDAATAEWRGRG